jgi:hypothetical protein
MMMMYSKLLFEEDFLLLFSDVGAAVGAGEGFGEGAGDVVGEAVDGIGVVGSGLMDGAGDGGMKVVGANVGGTDGNSVGFDEGFGVTVGAAVGWKSNIRMESSAKSERAPEPVVATKETYDVPGGRWTTASSHSRRGLFPETDHNSTSV